MNKILKAGLWMQGIQMSLMALVGVVLFLFSVTWSLKLLAAIAFVLFNIISLTMIVLGFFKGDPVESSDKINNKRSY